jgi:hypothetical protein
MLNNMFVVKNGGNENTVSGKGPLRNYSLFPMYYILISQCLNAFLGGPVPVTVYYRKQDTSVGIVSRL